MTTVGRIIFRWVTGRPLNGKLYTSSTFLKPGKPLTPTRHSTKWAMLPHAHHLMWRQYAVAVPAVALYGVITHAWVFVVSAVAAATGTLMWAGFKTWMVAREWRHRQRTVTPLHLALCDLLGVPEDRDPASYLSVPLGYDKKPGAEIRVKVTPQFVAASTSSQSGAQGGRDRFEQTVKATLGIGDADVEWHVRGAAPYVTFHPAAGPPAHVKFPDVAHLVEAAPESAPLLGIGRRARPISVDLDSESPHMLVSMGTGGGKSTILRAVTAQALHHGAQVVVCDVKRISHLWLRGLPGVEYWREPAEIHDALVRLGGEIDRRNRAVDQAHTDGTKPDVGPRIVLLMEEMNSTMDELRKYWQQVRPSAEHRTSPAVAAFGRLVFMGRQVRVHSLTVAQQATAAAVGGGAMRENYATRVLGRATRNTWRMLAPEITPVPGSSRHAGRVHVVLGGVAHETQVVEFTDAEARAYATSGLPQPAASPEWGPTTVAGPVSEAGNRPGRPNLHVVHGDGTVDVTDAIVTGQYSPVAGAVGDAEPLIGLSAAVATGVLTCSLKAARVARDRDVDFPQPASVRPIPGTVEKMYRPDDLRRWARNRPRARAGVGA